MDGPASVTVIESGVAIEGGIADGASASLFKFFVDRQGMHRSLVLCRAVVGAPTERTVKVYLIGKPGGDGVDGGAVT